MGEIPDRVWKDNESRWNYRVILPCVPDNDCQRLICEKFGASVPLRKFQQFSGSFISVTVVSLECRTGIVLVK